MMVKITKGRPVLAAVAAASVGVLASNSVIADDAQENQQLREQMRIMMQRMDELQKQVQGLSKPQAQAPSAAAAPAAPAAGPEKAPKVAKETSAEPLFEKFVKGFYGTLDVSLDDSTKGISGMTAYPYALSDPTNQFSPSVVSGGPKVGPVGRVGWQPDLSTNKSVIGYRGSHKIGSSSVDFIYQIETQPSITSSPGASTSYTAQSNTTKAGIGYGDTYVGVSDNAWGKFKFGTTYTPYKKSTDRLNPFSGMLGGLCRHRGQQRRRQSGRVRHAYRPLGVVRIAQVFRGLQL